MSQLNSNKYFQEQKIELPKPGPGTSREIMVLRYGVVGAKPKVYIQTALHADEIPGMLVIHHLRSLLDVAAEEGRFIGEVVIVPVANPIGMSQRIQGKISGRLDLNNGKNYNRHWHYPNLVQQVGQLIEGLLTHDSNENDAVIRQALIKAADGLPQQTESDAHRRALLSLCADSDYCLDLHCDLESILYLYSNGLHPEIANQLSAQLECEAHLVDFNNRFCFDAAISFVWSELAKLYPIFPIPMGCMSCTIELRGQSDVNDDVAKHDAANLMQFLINRKIVEGVQNVNPKAKCSATPLQGKIYIRSPVTGILSFQKNPGDQVREGEKVATLIDPLAAPGVSRIDLSSSISGIVVSRTNQRLVGPGQIVMGIAGRKAIPEQLDAYLLSD